MNSCYSENIIFPCLDILFLLPPLKSLICQYATCFPSVFTNEAYHTLFGLFPGSKHVECIQFIQKPSKEVYFHYFDPFFGTIVLADALGLFFEYYDLIVCGESRKLLAQKTNCPSTLAKKYMPSNSFGEDSVLCKCPSSEDNEIFLFLTLSWGWSQPETYLVSQPFMEKSIEHKLNWSYPAEICNYADGWVTRLYYVDDKLLLVTDKAIYITQISLENISQQKIKTTDWQIWLSFDQIFYEKM
jgi:hypothetical protein